jgi:hypothetical protein
MVALDILNTDRSLGNGRIVENPFDQTQPIVDLSHGCSNVNQLCSARTLVWCQPLQHTTNNKRFVNCNPNGATASVVSVTPQ